MVTLPVNRAMRIYATLAHRSEASGTRERLTKFLLKKYVEGERDRNRLTVEGLSYLRGLDRQKGSQG
jgi:ABC-type phosphate transport system substrate-binding protein